MNFASSDHHQYPTPSTNEHCNLFRWCHSESTSHSLSQLLRQARWLLVRLFMPNTSEMFWLAEAAWVNGSPKPSTKTGHFGKLNQPKTFYTKIARSIPKCKRQKRKLPPFVMGWVVKCKEEELWQSLLTCGWRVKSHVLEWKQWSREGTIALIIPMAT